MILFVGKPTLPLSQLFKGKPRSSLEALDISDEEEVSIGNMKHVYIWVVCGVYTGSCGVNTGSCGVYTGSCGVNTGS